MPAPTIPVSVNLIVKNCAPALDACLASLRTFLVDARDEVVIVDTGSTDGGATIGTARKFGARVLARPDFSQDARPLVRAWLPQFEGLFADEAQNAGGMLMDFGGARQVALDASRHDCVFWLDSDDTLWEQQPGMLRTVVEQGFKKQYDALVLGYEYLYDPVDGRCVTLLRRERVIDRRMYRWQGHCHELLVPLRSDEPGRALYYHDLPVRIRHTAHRQDHRRADVRNYLVLRSEVESDLAAGRAPAVRTLFYLGNACRGLGLKEEGLRHYRDTVAAGDSSPNRYAAQLYIAEMCLAPPELRPVEALAAARACVTQEPRDPRGHYMVSRAEAALGRWTEVLEAFEAGRRQPLPDTSFALDLEQLRSGPLLVAIAAAIELGRLAEARRLAEELSQLRPDHPDTRVAWAALEVALARHGTGDVP